MEQVRSAVGGVTGSQPSRGGQLPRLETEGEQGWERKEGAAGGGWGLGGKEGGRHGEGFGRTRGGGGVYDEEEGAGGVPGRSRERCPVDFSDWWNDWNLGLTYNTEEWSDALFWRAVFAEGAATTAFTYFVLSTWISLMEAGLTDIGVLRVALAAGLSYGVLNWAFHSISGGHMNPAVTMAVMLNGRITFLRALCYWGAQIVGGMVGALIAKGMSFSSFNNLRGGTNRVMGGIGWGSAFLGEIMCTLLLVFAFLVAYDRRRRFDADHVNVLAPLILGLAVTAAHLVLIPFTWCSINPARSFGPAVVANTWTHHWIWWVGPLIAGVLGPLIYESFFKYFYSVTSAEDIKRRQYQESQQGQGVQMREGVSGERAVGEEGRVGPGEPTTTGQQMY